MSPHVNKYDPGMLDLTDPAKRIATMDALGVDVQVVFSTFYIGVEVDNPLEEAGPGTLLQPLGRRKSGQLHRSAAVGGASIEHCLDHLAR
jgi:hypothetical protein